MTIHPRRGKQPAPQHGSPDRRDPARQGEFGISLIDTLLACVVLAVGIGSVTSTASRCTALQQETDDYARAHDECRDVFERLRGDLSTGFQAYKAAPVYQAHDLQVQVTFPAALLQQVLGQAPPVTARFRDLDGDGQIDLNAAGTDRTSPLPVQVYVTRGSFHLTMSAVLVQR